MKKITILFLSILTVALCAQTPVYKDLVTSSKTVGTDYGTFRLIGKNSKSVEVWAKDGVNTNKFVFVQKLNKDGTYVFKKAHK